MSKIQDAIHQIVLSTAHAGEPIGGHNGQVLARAGLMGNALPWREAMTRIILSVYPDSEHNARICIDEEKEGMASIGFQIDSGQPTDVEREAVVSITALCQLVSHDQLKELAAAVGIRALYLAGYADVLESYRYGPNMASVKTERHGTLAVAIGHQYLYKGGIAEETLSSHQESVEACLEQSGKHSDAHQYALTHKVSQREAEITLFGKPLDSEE